VWPYLKGWGGAEVLLWLVGYQQVIKDLVRGYILFIIQIIVFGEFCINVSTLIQLHSKHNANTATP
jgi:hypothetical protein